MTIPQNTADSPLQLDAVVVGAGFSGIYALQRLRDDLHLNVKIIEAGSGVGGVWYWNKFPGARVDVATSHYAFGFEEARKTWNLPSYTHRKRT